MLSTIETPTHILISWCWIQLRICIWVVEIWLSYLNLGFHRFTVGEHDYIISPAFHCYVVDKGLCVIDHDFGFSEVTRCIRLPGVFWTPETWNSHSYKEDRQCVCVCLRWVWEASCGPFESLDFNKMGGMGVKFSWEERVCSQGDLARFLAALPFSESPEHHRGEKIKLVTKVSWNKAEEWFYLL